MTLKVIEAASKLIENTETHKVVESHPWLKEAIVRKMDWWSNYVQTIAVVDGVKPVNEILNLAWNEHSEASEASEDRLLVELGDIVVFLVAAIVRDVISNTNPTGVLAMEEEYLASYVDKRLEGMGDRDGLRSEMIELVFKKIEKNFHPALNPPLPPDANHTKSNIVYAAAYSASRVIRKHAKERGVYDEDRGLPDEWGTVFSTNGNTPEHLLEVQRVSFEQMKLVGLAYTLAFGEEAKSGLYRHWELTAPGMVGEIAAYV